MMYENKHILNLRSLARRIGLTKLFSRLYAKKDYEAIFEKALLDLIEESDTVYDIGANRGFYTKKFLWKAKSGTVHAFEPIAENNKIISSLLPSYKNLKIYPVALGSNNSQLPMSIGNDELNATSKLKTKKGENDILVTVKKLDNIIEENNAIPDVIKIDVEGFELEVIKGMTSTLKNGHVKVIAVEVHFKLLQENGYQNAPKEIVNILKQNQFKIKWVDPSHIIATRGRN